VAKSFIVTDHARQCISVICPDWKPSGYNVWTNDVGEQIRLASNMEWLRGHAPGTVIYLGWGWRSKVRPHDLLEFRARGYVVEELKND
jgi:hypothetical protein